MDQHSSIDEFKVQFRELLKIDSQNLPTIKFNKNSNIYLAGDSDALVYYVESGQIKISISSQEGKECLLTIHTQGDLFGELCLSRSGERIETATAMTDSYLKVIPVTRFFQIITDCALLQGFVRYLVERIAEQRQVIANLVTTDCEQRLGRILLQLARNLGNQDTLNNLIRLKISHEELSEMVGTTRPRVSLFMQRFRNLGLIETTREHFLVIHELKLTNYLAQIA